MTSTATTPLVSITNAASGSYASAMLSPTSSVLAAATQFSESTNPTQFIPVGVLAVFLIMLFISHLMRCPRLLYVSAEHIGSQSHSVPDIIDYSREGRGFYSEKEHISRPVSFPTTSILMSEDFAPHADAIYYEPTIRLVRAYHYRSPEARVHSPGEMTPLSPSQTLINSSPSDSDICSPDVYDIPLRVYLPPVLSETLEPCYVNQPATLSSIDDDPTHLPSAPACVQHPPGLSIAPQAPSFAAFNDLINTSAEVFTLPFSQDQQQLSVPSANLRIETSETGPAPETWHPTGSPELSPPPPVHTQPIVVRRALAPWRRRSPEPSYETFLNMSEITTASAHSHRPSIPSRLRYFITRSTTTSLSGSRTRSTPDSSLGKRSEISLTASSQSLNHVFGSIISSRSEGEATGARVSDALLDAPAKPRVIAISRPKTTIPPTQSSKTSNIECNLLSVGGCLQDCQLLDDSRQLSVLEGATGRDVQVTPSARVEKDLEEREIRWCGQEDSGSLLSFEMHSATAPGDQGLGLGLRLVSESLPVERGSAHRILAPVSGPQSSASVDISGTPHSDMHVQGEDSRPDGSDFDDDDKRPRAHASLRTVFSRWMMKSTETLGGAPTLAGERGTFVDESVEIMVVGRSEGLDGV